MYTIAAQKRKMRKRDDKIINTIVMGGRGSRKKKVDGGLVRKCVGKCEVEKDFFFAYLM